MPTLKGTKKNLIWRIKLLPRILRQITLLCRFGCLWAPKNRLLQYQNSAGLLRAKLREGQNIAFLCLGDPSLYGSFLYLQQLLAPDFATVRIAGICAISVVAAWFAHPLALGQEIFTIIPASRPRKDIIAALAIAERAAIVKLGRNFSKIYQILTDLELLPQAVYGAKMTMPDQIALPLLQVQQNTKEYFATILVQCRPL